jgi:hypothetical protein
MLRKTPWGELGAARQAYNEGMDLSDARRFSQKSGAVEVTAPGWHKHSDRRVTRVEH